MVTVAQAAEELLRRRKARAHFRYFIEYVNPQYVFKWFHIHLANTLHDWATGSLQNLIINIPPRNGKSEQASRLAPAYIFGINPTANIIAASYSSDLASLMNRDVQRIIDTPSYRNLFPKTTLNRTNVRDNAQGNYLRNNDIFEIVGYTGQYRSTGRGGGITGMGGHFLIVDDPLKDKEEAASPTIKEKAYEWLTSTLFPRQADDQAKKLMIVTRWAVDDPVGRVLAKCDPRSEEYNPAAEQWHVITFPALAYEYDDPDRSPHDPRKPGEPLWPEKFGKKWLLAQRAGNAEDFQALQQQKPTGGGLEKFKREWFRLVKAVPMRAIRVRYWDKAGTEGAGAYTVGVLMAFDGVNYYIEDVIRRQLAYAQREKLIRQTSLLDWHKYGGIEVGQGLNPITVWVEQEPGSGGKESAERTVLQLAPFPVYAERVTGNKEVRANGLSAQAESGNVCVLVADWTEAYLNELEKFPKGKFKDQVDGSSGAFNKLSLGWEQVYTIVEEYYEAISPI